MQRRRWSVSRASGVPLRYEAIDDMAQLTTKQYDALERAITDVRRIVVTRRGTEYIVVPERLRMRDGRESIEAQNPTTGDRMVLHLDEIDALELVW